MQRMYHQPKWEGEAESKVSGSDCEAILQMTLEPLQEICAESVGLQRMKITLSCLVFAPKTDAQNPA
jgi:hypothetical protein